MTKEVIRLALEIRDEEDREITELLDRIADTCEICGRPSKDGADAGCLQCVARDVMNR